MSDSHEDDAGPGKTVFRPSPLQGLRGGGGGTAFMPGPAAPEPVVPDPAPTQAASVAPQPPPAAAAPVAPRPRLADDDIPRPAPAQRGRNPIMDAAAPVLALIAGVRAGRVHTSLPELHQKASAAVADFDRALQAAGLDLETRQRARYAVCATIDDIAQNLPGHGADGAEWARRSLVVQAFNENIGGDRFWRLLEEMLARPAENARLIELYHACLAVGFEGRYRVTPDGKRRLHEILTSAYAALPHVRELSETEIVPAWRGAPTPAGKVGFWAPLALAAGVTLAALLVVVLALRLVLVQTGQPSAEALRTLSPDQPLRLSRAAPAAVAPAGAQLERIRSFLAPEIAQGLVAVDQDAANIRIRTTVGQLFKSGSDVLEPTSRPLLTRIAAAVEPEPGDVRVEGHADSDRVSSLAFPDNFALSQARAEAAARIVRASLSAPARVRSEGFGASQPVASNATAEGKALNRRVEVVIPRGE